MKKLYLFLCYILDVERRLIGMKGFVKSLNVRISTLYPAVAVRSDKVDRPLVAS